MKKLAIVYNLFDAYISSYTTDITHVQKELYHQKHGVEILTTNLSRFFTEEIYTSTIFKRYATLFSIDADYIQKLFPEKKLLSQPIIPSWYKQLRGLEDMYVRTKTLLDMLTLYIWRVVAR